MTSRERAKKIAARRAVDCVEDGMVVGLGSGSTAAYAIRELGVRVAAGELDIVGVPTSMQAREAAQEAGISVSELAQVDTVDIVIDGADQVVGSTVIKGGGGAHARERVVAWAADEVVVVVDEEKVVDVLSRSVPVEVLANAQTVVSEAIGGLGGDARLRPNRHRPGPFITDNGGFVLECSFDEIESPGELSQAINRVPGVIAHGLCVDFADVVVVGELSGKVAVEAV